MPKLPGLKDKAYWSLIAGWAADNSDGCTGVPDHYVEACHEHDFHYRYATTLYGEPITFMEANARFKDAIQMRSKLRWFSPLSWIRFLGVTSFGKPLWDKHRERGLKAPIVFLDLDREA